MTRADRERYRMLASRSVPYIPVTTPLGHATSAK